MGLLNKLFPPPKPAEFAKLIEAQLRRNGVAGSIVFDREEFCLRLGEGGRVMFLNNAYHDYCAAPLGKRRLVVTRYAQVGMPDPVEHDASFAAAAANLLPRVQSRAYRETIHRMQDAPARGLKEPAHLALTAHLEVLLVQDHPQSISTVSFEMLDKWGVTPEAAMARARDNLWKRSNQDFAEIRPGLYLSPWRDNHDAARLYLYDLIWQLKVKGAHVALAPNRDVLLVTGDGDAEGLAAMAKLAEPELANRPVSGYALRLEERTWAEYLPPAGHPAHAPLQRLQLLTDIGEYAEQKAHLEVLDKKRGRDLFHATFTALNAPGEGGTFTVCVWSQGIVQTLPRTDRIAFVGAQDGKPASLGMARWEDVQAVMGAQLKPLESYPPRWEAQGFPDSKQVSALRLEPLKKAGKP